MWAHKTGEKWSLETKKRIEINTPLPIHPKKEDHPSKSHTIFVFNYFV